VTTLASRLADDLETAFGSLVETHQDAVFGTALRCTGQWQDAEEIAQETFVRAYRALTGWDRERILALRIRGWLLSITINVVRNRVRFDGRRPVTSELFEETALAVRSTTGLPEESMERMETRSALADALSELPESNREAVVLRHVAQLGYDEIALALDCPVGTVKARVHRGVRSLSALLQGDPRIVERL
jgi:RNA polymerase sigma-70 factor (ECF subfamily)